MRTIKFRAWDVNHKRMHLWEELKKADYLTRFIEWTSRKILMQFTGLLDKHGKEIYEGDIVNVYDDIGPEPSMGKKFDRYTVKLGDYAFMAFLETMIGDIEIIGNIYENPNLLNV